MIDITLLGTGGGMPMPFRYLSSAIVKYNGRRILIDCGEGTQVAMRKFKTGFIGIDIILISHLHGDHIFGLPGLLSTLGNTGRTDPISIIGPKGIREVIGGLILSLGYLPYKLNIIEDPKEINLISQDLVLKVQEEDKDDYEIKIETISLDHSIACLGYSLYLKRKPRFYPERALEKNIPLKIWSRLQNNETVILEGVKYTPDMVLGEERRGIKLSYITDTRPKAQIIDFIKDSDLFICEGTYGDQEDLDKAIKNKHMTFSEAASLAKDGNVDKLLITHYSPSLDNPKDFIDNGKKVFANTVLAYDGYSESLIFKD